MNKLRFILKSFSGLSLFRFLALIIEVKIFWLFNNQESFQKDKKIYKFNFRYKRKLTIYIRKQDLPTFFEVFYNEIYKTSWFSLYKPKILIDLGAHIGFTSLYYNVLFPEAKIICVEPSEENQKILSLNLPHVHVINAAISNLDGNSKLNTSSKSVNYKIDEIGEVIETITFNSLLKSLEITNVDLLKIDIEGAESLMMESFDLWNEKVGHLIIECHNNESLIEPQLKSTKIKFRIV